jgi:signal transduction histidine kinase
VSLATVVETCWADLDTGAATLRIETDRTLLAESRRFERLLTNLLGNIVKHGSTNPPSRDPSGDDGPGARVTVGDLDDGFYVAVDGPGVESTNRERIFELGYADGDGPGFGLSIVEEFAVAHGWTVGVTTSEAGGARFDVVGVDTA